MHGTEDFLGHEFARGDELTDEMISSNKSLEPDGWLERKSKTVSKNTENKGVDNVLMFLKTLNSYR